MYKNRFFDFEVLPHWWLCVFGDLPEDYDMSQPIPNDIKNNFVVISSDDKDAREHLLAMLREPSYCNIGYNIKGYDLIIANAIYQGFTSEQVKIVNDLIINPNAMWESKEHMRLQPFAKKRLRNVIYQDLMDDSSGSLKEKEAILGLNILESTVDFNDENLNDDKKADLIYYCKQDVYASMEFFRQIVHPYITTKLDLGRKFGIPEDVCRASTNARLVAMALKAKKQVHADDNRSDIDIPSKIKQYVYDNLPLNIINAIRLSPEGFTTKLFDNEVSFGNGGIHSTYIGNYNTPPCLYLESDDEYVLRNVDASSYYPSIMIQLGLLSRNVSDRQVFIDIFDERIYLKLKENPTPEEVSAQKSDKLVLNTTFGASGNKYLDLYDPYMCTSVCRVGQLFLGAFACKLARAIPSAKIVQTNTDGVLTYLPKKDLPILHKLMEEWSAVSGINMEEDIVEKIWQRDVNNYLMVLNDKGKTKIKRKGGWLNDTFVRAGYVTLASVSAYVSAKAAQNYLLNKGNIVDFIKNEQDLSNFAIVCTKGPTYSGVVQRMSDGSEVKLFKANRIIATKNTAYEKLYKVKKVKNTFSYTMMPNTPSHCLLINKALSEYNFDEIKSELDYDYYIERCKDLLNIQWVQINHNIITDNHDWEDFKT